MEERNGTVAKEEEEKEEDKKKKKKNKRKKKKKKKQVAQASLWSAVADAPLISFGIMVLR